MHPSHVKDFNTWWTKYSRCPGRTPARVARASWDAAWHLMESRAHEEGRKQAAEAVAALARCQRLLDKACSEIDQLEACLEAV